MGASPAQAQWAAGNVTLIRTHSAYGTGAGYVHSANHVMSLAEGSSGPGETANGGEKRDFGREYVKTGSPGDLTVRIDGFAAALASYSAGPYAWAHASGYGRVESLTITTGGSGQPFAAASAFLWPPWPSPAVAGGAFWVSGLLTDTATLEVQVESSHATSAEEDPSAAAHGESEGLWSDP
jgi:hypothetical protein